MNKTTFDFSEILNKIETALCSALPETANENWTLNSFGDLDKNITFRHIQNLIEPNQKLMELGGKRWRPLLLILCYQMSKKLNGKNALSEEQVYSYSSC